MQEQDEDKEMYHSVFILEVTGLRVERESAREGTDIRHVREY